MLVPAADADAGRRVSSAILRELESGLAGFSFALGRSRRVQDPLDLQRAYDEALLALNVAEGDAERSELAYEETGTYQLLLPYMSDPAELKRFYDETVRPLVAYDEQYETDLLGTLADVPRMRRERQRDRRAADHPPPHDPLSLRACARADRARRLIDRRPREAVARAQGDARARLCRTPRPGERAGRGRRPGPALISRGRANVPFDVSGARVTSCGM